MNDIRYFNRYSLQTILRNFNENITKCFASFRNIYEIHFRKINEKTYHNLRLFFEILLRKFTKFNFRKINEKTYHNLRLFFEIFIT